VISTSMSVILTRSSVIYARRVLLLQIEPKR
jgi:hypothetical protein